MGNFAFNFFLILNKSINRNHNIDLALVTSEFNFVIKEIFINYKREAKIIKI